MASQQFFIEGRMPGLNEYIRTVALHRNAGGEMKKEWDEVVELSAMAAQLGHFTEPITVEFHWYEPNTKRDLDNISFAKKFILDGLQKAGVLSNDNFAWVKGFSDHFHYEGKSGVLVIMTEVENDGPNIDVPSVGGVRK